MHTTDDLHIAIIQWPSRLLGTGPTIESAARAAKKYLHPSLAGTLPQASRGIRSGDIRWATISEGDAHTCEGSRPDDVILDMLHSRPGHVLAWVPNGDSDPG